MVAILMPSPTGFAKRLKELREAAGLTQAELADRAGLHQFGVAKLEQGLREPGWATALSLAKALGISVADFVVEEGGQPREPPRRPRGRPKRPEGPTAPEPPAPKRGRGKSRD